MALPFMDELTRRFKHTLRQLEYLHDRWLDERHYEDWRDYVIAMQQIMPEFTEFVSASQRPFGFVCVAKNGSKIRFFATATKVGFEVL